MAKKTLEVYNRIGLSIGDDTRDTAMATCGYRAYYPDHDIQRGSSIMIEVPLPEGAILEDSEAAKAAAKKEVATILRKMAASLA